MFLLRPQTTLVVTNGVHGPSTGSGRTGISTPDHGTPYPLLWARTLSTLRPPNGVTCLFASIPCPQPDCEGNPGFCGFVLAEEPTLWERNVQ